MIIEHGFHATMTVRPGKSDEVVALPLDVPSPPNSDRAVFVVGRSAGNPAASDPYTKEGTA